MNETIKSGAELEDYANLTPEQKKIWNRVNKVMEVVNNLSGTDAEVADDAISDGVNGIIRKVGRSAYFTLLGNRIGGAGFTKEQVKNLAFDTDNGDFEELLTDLEKKLGIPVEDQTDTK